MLPGQVIPVMRAMQGHPELSRLWKKHIDRIIKKHGFKPTVHEPCLYLGFVQGERCIFKRQVDDFALATASEETAHHFLHLLDNEITMPMKRLGLISLFNGIDILQSKYFIKISCQTYIEKMAKRHLDFWMRDLKMTTFKPMKSFMKSFDTAVGDPDEKVQANLEKEYKFGNRSGFGEIIYAVTSRGTMLTTQCLPRRTTLQCSTAHHQVPASHKVRWYLLLESKTIGVPTRT